MKDKIKNIPESPGVYKFFSNKELIYIGKAKNLKKRTSSYFGKSLKDRKTNQIRRLTDHIEVFITNNEVEALLLEQNLIKENKPRFNILLRDDKTYPYIYFSLDQEFPGVYLKRTKGSVNKNYIGPFISSQAVKNSIKDIQKYIDRKNLILEIDLVKSIAKSNDLKFKLQIKETSKKMFLSGEWDATSKLLENEDLIEEKLNDLPYIQFN